MKAREILAKANALNPKERKRFTELLIEKRDRPRVSSINYYAIMRSKGIALSHGVWYFRHHVLQEKDLAMPIYLLFGDARDLSRADLNRLINELTRDGAKPSP